jgi:sulfur carrier protein ThiS
MANKVTAQVLGGQVKVLDQVETVQDVLDILELSGSYTASINGEPASNDAELNDYEFVSFSPAVKGGAKKVAKKKATKKSK